MTTLEQLRGRAERIQAEFERGLDGLFRDSGRRERIYSDDEHEQRVRALERERARQLDEVLEEVRRLVAEAELELAALEGGDPTRFLSVEELAAAAAKKSFVEDDVRGTPADQLQGKLRAVLDGGDTASIFVYWRASETYAATQDLREVLDEMRDTLAGEARLARVAAARKTIEEAVAVELLASNLKRGARSASVAWVRRRVGSGL